MEGLGFVNALIYLGGHIARWGKPKRPQFGAQPTTYYLGDFAQIVYSHHITVPSSLILGVKQNQPHRVVVKIKLKVPNTFKYPAQEMFMTTTTIFASPQP